MNITFSKAENALEIKDNLKWNQTIIWIVLGMNIINPIIRLIGKDILRYGLKDFLFVFIGIVSLIVGFTQFYKKSTAEKIVLKDINSINEKPFFFRKHVFLKLNNGKTRDLGIFREDHEDIIQIRNLFNELDIPSNRKS